MKKFKLDITDIEISGAEYHIASALAHAIMADCEISGILENYKIIHTSIIDGIKLEKQIQSMPAKEREELLAAAQKKYEEIVKEFENKDTTSNGTSTKFTS